MDLETFQVKYVSNKTCFLYFSQKWSKVLNKIDNCVIKLYYKDHQFYFSASIDKSLNENEVGINPTFAGLYQLDENELVTIKTISNVQPLTRVVVAPLTEDDWTIIELNGDVIQATLLNLLKVVSVNQKILIWINKSLNVVVQIISLVPNGQVGYIQNLTEIEIVPKIAHRICDNDFIEDDEVQENNGKFNVNNILEKEFSKLTKCVYRVWPTPPHNSNKLNDHLKLLLTQPFNVFVRKKYFGGGGGGSDVSYVNCKLYKIKNDDSVDNNKEAVYVRMHLLSDDNVKSIAVQETIINENERFVTNDCLNVNENIIILSQFLIDNYYESKTPVLIDFNLDAQATLNEINLISNTKLNEFTLDYFFKTFVLKNENILLNNAHVLFDTMDCKCLVKFLPDTIKFVCLHAEMLRNTKIKVIAGDECDIQLNKMANIKQKRQLVNNFENKPMSNSCCYWNIIKLNELIQSAIDNVIFGFLNSTPEHLLIYGDSGSGKSELCKKILDIVGNEPFNFYVNVIECGALKGKKLESVYKTFHNVLEDSIYYQPTVLLFDDLDTICGQSKFDTIEIIDENTETFYFNKMSEMFMNLISSYTDKNKISVICTTKSKTSLNPQLHHVKGSHFFKTVYGMPTLSNCEKIDIFKDMLMNYKDVVIIDDDVNFSQLKFDGYCVQDLNDFTQKSIFESIKRSQGSSGRIGLNKRLVGGGRMKNIDIENAFKHFVPLSYEQLILKQTISLNWQQIGGLFYAKTKLIETILWPTKHIEMFKSCPLKLANGILIYGHPGSGKSILCSAAAEHFNLRLISVKGPQLLSKYIGQSEQAVRDVFQRAQSAKPCILFFDEFDSLAPRRGHDNTGVTDRVVNQFLTQLDGVVSMNDNVYVIAATSRPDLIDPALVRPGRLGCHIQCHLPNQDERLSILTNLSVDLNLCDDVDLQSIAVNTKHFTGADLKAILTTAQLSVAQQFIQNDINNEQTNDCLLIKHADLEKALNETKPSLSSRDKNKYDLIYENFRGGGGGEKTKKSNQKMIQKITMA